MKSTTDGVKYPKGIKVNARRKRALERLEKNLISLTSLKQNSKDELIKIKKDPNYAIQVQEEYVQSLTDTLHYVNVNIPRIEKEIEVLKERIY
jgi:hypothetical protein